MTETQPQPHSTENLSPRERAFQLTQEILRDPARLEAVKAGVASYTRDVDAQFQKLDAVQQASSSSEVFSDATGGAPWMLWGAVVGKLESGQHLTLEDLQGPQLQEMVRQAYAHSGASGT